MPKVKPVGEAGTKTVMVTAEPGLTKEQVEAAVNSLPEIKEFDDAEINVVNQLRNVAMQASIENVDQKVAEMKREETIMADQKNAAAQVQVPTTMEISPEMKAMADAIARQNLSELAKMEQESKDEPGFIDRIKENWDLMLGTAVLVAALYFAYKNLFASNDSMAQDMVTSGLELIAEEA